MKAVVRLLTGILVAMSLAACHAPSGEAGHDPAMQLKLYQVPAGQSEAIADHLGADLEDTGFRVGTKTQTNIRVTQPFPGVVMVLAPASVQPSIGQAIAGLGKVADNKAPKADSAAPQAVPVQVTFWLVQARAGNGADSPALAALEPALKRMRGTLGPSHFALDESVSSATNAAMPQLKPGTSYGGQLVTAQGHQYSYKPQVTADGDVLLWVQYQELDSTKRTIGNVQTVLTMHPDQYVILASAPSDKSDKGTLLNLLVARVDRPAPASH